MKPGRVIYQSPTLYLFKAGDDSLIAQSARLNDFSRVAWEKELAPFRALQWTGAVPAIRASVSLGSRVWTTLSYAEGIPLVQRLAQSGEHERIWEVIVALRRLTELILSADRGGYGVGLEQVLYQCLYSREREIFLLPAFLREYIGQTPWDYASHTFTEGMRVGSTAFCRFLRGVLLEFFPPKTERNNPFVAGMLALIGKLEDAGKPLQDTIRSLESFYEAVDDRSDALHPLRRIRTFAR